jgi:hypothetical protein
MIINEKFKSTIGFIDIIFNILIGFAFLFIIAFILIKPEAKKEDFERKAEFVITMEWPLDRVEDVDLWVSDPHGSTASFRTPRVNLMHLDKDDLGTRNDTVMVNGLPVVIKINREVITIRGIIPGEYIVNAHLYSNYNSELPFNVTVEVIKVNPVYSVIFKGEKAFTYKGQEQTFIRFKIDHEGNVVELNTLKKNFIVPGTSYGGSQVELEDGRD